MSLRLTTAVGNITGLNNQVPLPKPGGLGGPVSQSFGYDELDRLTRASGTWQGARNEQERYTLTMAYDAIHNITHKSQTHVRVPSKGRELTQAKTTYDWAYAYTGAQPHAPTQIDNRRFAYDANGNQTGWVSEKNASRRTLVWDEENRLRSVADNGRTQRYVYDALTQPVGAGHAHKLSVFPELKMRNKQNAHMQGIAFIMCTMLFAYASRVIVAIFGMNVADKISEYSFEKIFTLIISLGILYGLLYIFSYFFICNLFKFIQFLAKKIAPKV